MGPLSSWCGVNFLVVSVRSSCGVQSPCCVRISSLFMVCVGAPLELQWSVLPELGKGVSPLVAMYTGTLSRCDTASLLSKFGMAPPL